MKTEQMHVCMQVRVTPLDAICEVDDLNKKFFGKVTVDPLTPLAPWCVFCVTPVRQQLLPCQHLHSTPKFGFSAFTARYTASGHRHYGHILHLIVTVLAKWLRG